MSKRTLGLPVRQAGVLALIIAACIWGVGPVITKQGLFEIPPFSLGFLRNALALIIFLPFLFKGALRVKRADLPALLAVGLFSSALAPMFFLLGLERTSASVASTIFATVPLINSIAASLFLKEQPTNSRILGVIVGFLGSIIIALGPGFLNQAEISGNVWGNFLIVGGVFSWVAYIIASKRL